MSCTLTFECEKCGEQAITDPLAGGHNELQIRVSYPKGWWTDGDAWYCPAPSCTETEVKKWNEA
jgi:hypothetical protein